MRSRACAQPPMRLLVRVGAVSKRICALPALSEMPRLVPPKFTSESALRVRLVKFKRAEPPEPTVELTKETPLLMVKAPRFWTESTPLPPK